MTNRRDFLKTATLVAAGGVLATSCDGTASAKAPVKKSFGLQIYSLGGELHEDVPGGLKKVAEMGYSYLELAGSGFRDGEYRVRAVPIGEFKKYCDDAGLEIRSTHVGHSRAVRDDRQLELDHWKRAFDEHIAIGCKYVIQPGDPGWVVSTEDVAFLCDLYNEIGRLANSVGVKFGFHNHEREFQRLAPGGTARLPLRMRDAPEGNVIMYNAMLNGTDPSLVKFQNDVYWTVIGQSDPVAYMKNFPQHIRLLHIKDVNILGESGMMNFKKIFETAYELGIEDFFVEMENISALGMTQFEGVKACAEYLQNVCFVK